MADIKILEQLNELYINNNQNGILDLLNEQNLDNFEELATMFNILAECATEVAAKKKRSEIMEDATEQMASNETID